MSRVERGILEPTVFSDERPLRESLRRAGQTAIRIGGTAAEVILYVAATMNLAKLISESPSKLPFSP